VAVECDRYGYRFEAKPSTSVELALNVLESEDTPEDFNLRMPIHQPGGERTPVDIRTLPFVRFDDNEAHSQLYGINLGEGVRGVGPDPRHPFIVRNTLLWNNFWAFRPAVPSMIVDGMVVNNGRYALYRPVFDHHAYGRFSIEGVEIPSDFARGDKPQGLDLPPRPKTTFSKEIAGKKSAEAKAALARHDLTPFTMNPQKPEPSPPRVAVTTANYPAPLDPLDDLPPATVITHVVRHGDGLVVRGTTSDNGTVVRVLVNGMEAHALRPNFAEWEITVPALKRTMVLTALARDAADNVETRPHRLEVAWP
jgi:hypothetical protein